MFVVSMDELRVARAREDARRLCGVEPTDLQCRLLLLYFAYGWKTSAAVRAVMAGDRRTA